MYGDWGILNITVVGNLLAQCTGMLRQWVREKWACRLQDKPKTVVVTGGNCSTHAIVIMDQGRGLNLEDLATGSVNNEAGASHTNKIFCGALAALWIMLLLTVTGKEENTWFIFAVGGIGMLHNILIAGIPRKPPNFGIYIKFENVYGHRKVFEAL